ncbi:MAG: Recombinase [Clostridiales bacterium]|jgi:hypothetical protein|nr:Recombinase [Clostridiales bacterium]
MKHTTVSYKIKRQIVRPESEWLVFKNTHEPLITQELWDIVQSIRKHKKRPPKKMDTPNMFSGLVFCEDCGGTLVQHRAHTMEYTKTTSCAPPIKSVAKKNVLPLYKGKSANSDHS